MPHQYKSKLELTMKTNTTIHTAIKIATMLCLACTLVVPVHEVDARGGRGTRKNKGKTVKVQKWPKKLKGKYEDKEAEKAKDRAEAVSNCRALLDEGYEIYDGNPDAVYFAYQHMIGENPDCADWYGPAPEKRTNVGPNFRETKSKTESRSASSAQYSAAACSTNFYSQRRRNKSEQEAFESLSASCQHYWFERDYGGEIGEKWKIKPHPTSSQRKLEVDREYCVETYENWYDHYKRRGYEDARAVEEAVGKLSGGCLYIIEEYTVQDCLDEYAEYVEFLVDDIGAPIGEAKIRARDMLHPICQYYVDLEESGANSRPKKRKPIDANPKQDDIGGSGANEKKMAEQQEVADSNTSNSQVGGGRGGRRASTRSGATEEHVDAREQEQNAADQQEVTDRDTRNSQVGGGRRGNDRRSSTRSTTVEDDGMVNGLETGGDVYISVEDHEENIADNQEVNSYDTSNSQVGGGRRRGGRRR